MASSKSRRSVQVTSSKSSSFRDSTQENFPSMSDDTGIGIESPLSPTRLSRIQEKQQLSNLNDRLAQYIDRVRQLEAENQRLSYQVRTTEETVVKERNNIKSTYENELADARRLLDETAKEKAKLQIESGKYRAQFDELHGRVAKLERDLKDSEGRRMYAEGQVQDLQGKLNTAENQRKHWEDEAKKLRVENDNLRKQLASCQKQLEEETLLRVDLENRLQSLREEMAFNKQLYEQELNETRTKRQTEITEINTALEGEYRQKLQDGLSEMRGQFDLNLRMNRKEIEDMYEAKMADMRAMADRSAAEAAHAREELRKIRSSMESFERDRDKYEGLVSSLERKIRDLEDQLKAEKDGYYSRLAQRDDEIRRLQHEIAEMMQQYQDLMDVKIQLDVEIEAYRKLLEGEECRLRLTPTEIAGVKEATERHTVGTPRAAGGEIVQRGAKRKRVLQEREIESEMTYKTNMETKGGVEVLEHDLEGMYVKLHNKSDKDVPLGGWVIKREANNEEVTYKFTRAFVLKAGKTVTVWSSNAQVTHSPPNDIVMKNQQWPVGSNIRTALFDSDETEVAWRLSTRSVHSERQSFRSDVGAPGLRSSGTGVNGIDDQQKCLIM